MMKKYFLFILVALFAAPVFAQGNFGNASQLGGQVLQLEEQVRQMRGENENLRHQLDQMKAQQRRFQEDMEFRLNGNTGAPAMPVAAPALPANNGLPHAGNYTPPALPAPTALTPPVLPTPEYSGMGSPEMGSVTVPAASNTSFEISPTPNTLRLPSESPSTPRELYNQAFQMLNQSNYEGAEKAFSRFTNDFTSDPLIGNAWYWLGETYYVRRNYVQAADSFRQGFSAIEDGPKAGDNLLKLAMSLAALEKDSEACVVLRQVDSNYSSNSTALKGKTEQEIKRLGC